jgi:hypothetical protein
MSAAHLHKLHLLLLCKSHPGAISVMTEMQKRYPLSGDYYKCCNYLQTYQIHGQELYTLWKDTCGEDYDKFLTYYFIS